MRPFLIAIPLLAALLASCNTKQYPECDPKHIVEDWGVTDNSRMFGQYDSIYYLVNPVGNVQDSLYYNGNYTDSYYHSDSTRVTLRYTLQDSIVFAIERMYAVETNPDQIIMVVKEKPDTLVRECVLHLKKELGSDMLFRCGPDSIFKSMLMDGHELKVEATNGSSTSEPQGSQNYTFRLYTAGFKDAFEMAYRLTYPDGKDHVRPDSMKHHKEFKLF